MSAKISDLKKSIKKKEELAKIERIVADEKKDQEMTKIFAEKAGLVWDAEIDKDGHDDGQYIGSKTQWEIFNRLDTGELQICRKCSEITKGNGDRDYSLCGSCAF